MEAVLIEEPPMTNVINLFPTEPAFMDCVLAGYCARAGGDLVAAYLHAAADVQRHARERGLYFDVRLYKLEENDFVPIE